MQHENQYLHRTRRPNHLLLMYYFDAGLVAGTAAFSSLAGVLFAGFLTSFLTAGATAGALAAGAGAGALAGSAANAVNANAETIVAIIAFIIFPFY